MNEKTTPAPWSVELDVAQNGDIDVMTSDMRMVARIDCREEPDDDESPARETALANAHLIAASPELLAALNDLWIWASEQRIFLGSDPIPDGLGAQTLAAIAKATGEPVCELRGDPHV
jgi:hypothetical protein